MVVVFGASGNTGSVVANTLLDRGQKVRVVARDAKKLEALRARGAEALIGDVEDSKTVDAGFAGADAAYVLLPPKNDEKDFIARGRRIVDHYETAIEKHHPKHVVLLSSVGAQLASGTGPIVTVHFAEEAFRKISGTVFTFVRAAYFMENVLNNAHAMKTDGVLPVFGGGEGYPFPMIATRDIGEVAANALLAPPKSTEVIELSGPKEYSFADAAAEASTILGRPVKPLVIPIDQLVPTFTKFGMSENVASLYREMTEAFGRGAVKFEGAGRAVHGKVTLAEVLRAGLK